MAFEARNFNLFGLDLGRGWREFRQGCADSLSWSGFAWLSPLEPVQVMLPDGTTQWRAGASARLVAPGNSGSSRAVLLPDDIILFRDLVLPDLVRSDLEQALALQVSEHSPFVADDLVWGWRALPREDGRLDVRVALTSRAHIGKHLAAVGMSGDERIEVWAGESAPIVIRGFSESSRERRESRQREYVFAALALLILLLLALAATPFMLQRERIFDAQHRYAQLVNETAQAVTDREALLKTSARLRVVKAQLQGQVDIPRLLDTLTRVLPDSAHLNRLEVTGRQVRIGGFAANAAALVEALGAQPGFHDVRTPSAISRSGDGRESFSMEFVFQDAEASQ